MKSIDLSLPVVCILVLLGLMNPAAYGGIDASVMEITHSSDQALMLFHQARNHIENLESPAAVPLLEEAIQLDPEFALAHLYLARVTPRSADRIQSLERAVRLNEIVSIGESHLIHYTHAGFTGDVSKQRHHLYDLIRLFPDDKRIRFMAGSFYFERGDYGPALSHLLKAVALDPSYAPPHNMLGYSYMRLEQYTDAEASFKTYISLLPDHPNPYDSYGEFLQKTGRYSESILQYEKALEKDPEFVLAWYGIGDNFVFLRRYHESRESYQKLFDNAPSSGFQFAALRAIMSSHLHEGHTEKALGVVDSYQVLARTAQDPAREADGHAIASWIYNETEQPERGLQEAIAAQKVVQSGRLNDVDRAYYQVQSRLWHSFALIHNRKFRKARSLLREVKTMAEERQHTQQLAQYNFAMGLMEAQRGKFTKALRYLDMADQYDPLVMYYIARVSEQAGELEVARQIDAQIDTWNSNGLSLGLVRAKRQQNFSQF